MIVVSAYLMAARVLRSLLRAKGSYRLPSVPRALPVVVNNAHRLSVTPSNFARSSQHDSAQLQRCSLEGNNFCVTWSDGEQSKYHSMWLRHNCQCPECWDSSSNLKRAAADVLQGNPVISTAPALSDSDNPVVNIHWVYGEGGHTHKGFINLKWLKENSYSRSSIKKLQQKTCLPVTDLVPKVDYSEVNEGENGLWKWLKNLNQFGVCLLTGVPKVPGEIGKIAELAGGLQRTHYGTVLDVISSGERIDLVSSTTALPLHMDMCHLEAPPGLQILHCIRNDVEGGRSSLLDVFPVINELRTKFPQHFTTLTEVPATFSRFKTPDQSENPISFSHRKPHIMLDKNGEVIGVNWNNGISGPLLAPEEDVERYYEAICCLEKMLSDPKFQLSHQLKPGEVLSLYNRRFMHGRSLVKLSGGVRHMQTAYVTSDDLNSKVRVLASKCDPYYEVKAAFDGFWF